MYKYRIANFQNIPTQQKTDLKSLREIRRQERERRKQTLSKIKLGAMGLGGLGGLYLGGRWYTTGHNLYNEIDDAANVIGRQKAITTRDAKALVDGSRMALKTQLAGAGLALGGIYALTKAAKQIARERAKNRKRQLTTQYNYYDPDDQYLQYIV